MANAANTTTIRIPVSLAKQLKAVAKSKGVFLHHVVKVALDSYLASQSKGQAA
jgi:hypothetical protein